MSNPIFKFLKLLKKLEKMEKKEKKKSKKSKHKKHKRSKTIHPAVHQKTICPEKSIVIAIREVEVEAAIEILSQAFIK